MNQRLQTLARETNNKRPNTRPDQAIKPNSTWIAQRASVHIQFHS